MFRCMTILKGLIIGIDSFQSNDIDEWRSFVDDYECVFLTSKEYTGKILSDKYGKHTVKYVPNHYMKFSPNQSIHESSLKQLNLLTSEIAYISQNREFIVNALCFMSGAIYITGNNIPYTTYEDASQQPDLVCSSLKALKKALNKDIAGCLGEAVLIPDREIKTGCVMDIRFEDEEVFLLVSLGRYFGYNHYMSQLHPYSTAIYLNKHEGGKAYGIFNLTFAKMYSLVVQNLKSLCKIDYICNVPVKPSQNNRFKEIIQIIVKITGVEDISDDFLCIRNYKSQKGSTTQERKRNVQGVFKCNNDLSGKNIIIIDDVITTGATIQECVRALKEAGAENVFAVVLAVNQLGGNYWSANYPMVKCPKCGDKMKLLVNSKNKKFFYSCPNCRNSTLDYFGGQQRLIASVNLEVALSDEWV